MNSWTLETNKNPLAAIRQFLHSVWRYADLEGMVVTTCELGHATAKMTLVNDPKHLNDADPFVPLMMSNAGRMIADLAYEMPDVRLGIVLRACELRAFDELVKINKVNLEKWLIMGVECLGCFPADDFKWRVQNAGGMEQLTDLVLRNARQGGIALNRFRSACQMCSKPEPSHFDLCLELLGLPAKGMIIVFAKNDATVQKLHLQEITDGPASLELIGQHDIMVKIVEERRQRARDRQIRELFPHQPASLDQLMDFLMECQPCRKCVEACPVHPDFLISSIDRGAISRSEAEHWLISCAECGMCEEACPKRVPLAAIMNRISRKLKREAVAV